MDGVSIISTDDGEVRVQVLLNKAEAEYEQSEETPRK